MSDITWSNDRVRLRDLKPWEHNPRQITRRAAQRLLDSWRDYGQVQMIVVGPANEVYDGHQRLSALKALYGDEYEVEVRRASRPLTDDERKRLVVLLHAGATGQWDWDALSGWDADKLNEWGMNEEALKVWRNDIAALSLLLQVKTTDEQPSDPPQIAEQWMVIVICDDEQQQIALLERLNREGYKCRALIS